MTEQQQPETMSQRVRRLAGHGTADGQAEPEQTQTTDFDGGARTTTPLPPRMDDLIRRAAGTLPPAA